MQISSLLNILKAVGPAVAALPDFKHLYDLGVAALHPADQATAKEAYQDAIEASDEAYARLDAKLEAAKGQ